MVKKVAKAVFVASFIVLASSFFLYYVVVVDSPEDSVYASVLVSHEKSGFDLNATALTFGSIIPGAVSSRSVQITNPYPSSARAFIQAEGSIGSVLEYTPIVELGPHETKSIGFVVRAQNETEQGLYEGYVTVNIR